MRRFACYHQRGASAGTDRISEVVISIILSYLRLELITFLFLESAINKKGIAKRDAFFINPTIDYFLLISLLY